jgi:hypothetical protein
MLSAGKQTTMQGHWCTADRERQISSGGVWRPGWCVLGVRTPGDARLPPEDGGLGLMPLAMSRSCRNPRRTGGGLRGGKGAYRLSRVLGLHRSRRSAHARDTSALLLPSPAP